MFSSFTTDRGKQLVIIPQEQEEAGKQLFWIVVGGTMPPTATCRLMQFPDHCLLKLVLKNRSLSKATPMCMSGQVWNQTSFISLSPQLLSETFRGFVGENRGSPSN